MQHLAGAALMRIKVVCRKLIYGIPVSICHVMKTGLLNLLCNVNRAGPDRREAATGGTGGTHTNPIRTHTDPIRSHTDLIRTDTGFWPAHTGGQDE